jgi:hypothetical protein
MPRYAALIYGSADNEGVQVSDQQMQEVMEAYNGFGESAGDVIAGGEALHETNTATTITVPSGQGGEAVFTDGPFAETKEVLGGFYLLDCADLDEALKWAQQIPAAWMGGKVEVRPCVDFSAEG